MELSERDLAYLVWGGGATIAALLFWSDLRRSVYAVIGGLRPFLGLILLYTLYFVAVVAGMAQLGFWNTGLLRDTIIWFVAGGLATVFKFDQTYKDPTFFRQTLRRLITVSVLIEFLVGLSSFSFGVELLLIPAIVFVSLLSAVMGTNPEYALTRKWTDRLLALLGLVLLSGAANSLIAGFATRDWPELGLMFFLPVWATIATLPFVFLLALVASYRDRFDEINRRAESTRARRRAKLALFLAFGPRNRALARMTTPDIREVAAATSWAGARRILAFKRAGIRFEQAKSDLAAQTLTRYAGVEGTDWRGHPLDQRGFPKTKQALDRLALLQRSKFEQNGRYDAGLDAWIFVAAELPKEHGIVMRVNKKGTAWMAWRQTEAGWYLGIGADDPPPDRWTYEGPDPPAKFPRKGAGWRHGDFDEQDDD